MEHAWKPIRMLLPLQIPAPDWSCSGTVSVPDHQLKLTIRPTSNQTQASHFEPIGLQRGEHRQAIWGLEFMNAWHKFLVTLVVTSGLGFPIPKSNVPFFSVCGKWIN